MGRTILRAFWNALLSFIKSSNLAWIKISIFFLMDWFLLKVKKWKFVSDSLQLYLTLCNPMDCSPAGSSVHGILQARILQWVAVSFSRGSSWPGVSCIADRFFTIWAPREAIFVDLTENSEIPLHTYENDQNLEHWQQQMLARIQSKRSLSFIAGTKANGTTALEDGLVVSCKTKHALYHNTMLQLCSFGACPRQLKHMSTQNPAHRWLE